MAGSTDLGTSGSNPAPDQEVVLELKALCAGYGDLMAVTDLSLTLRRSEVVALFGPNGAGKSTTLLATVGALPRMRGEVLWMSRPASSYPHKLARSGLSYVPEGRSVVTGLSVVDNLRLGKGGIKDALSYFPELEPLLTRRAGLLSGGEQQMLVLARALAARPTALLVDELSLGLAPLVVERLFRAIRAAVNDDGLAVLLVEQEARRALAVADRWLLIDHGRELESGTSGEDAKLHMAYKSIIGAESAAAGGDQAGSKAAPGDGHASLGTSSWPNLSHNR
jgi:branched-chain amino acid transport system ATP-binding protein